MIYDVAVVGAGIAGAAAGYELARTHRVLVLEREAQPGYHATGRSAALYTETYGPRIIRALARASRSFLDRPPEGFAAGSLLSPRGVLFTATTDHDHLAGAFQQTAVDQVAAGGAVPVIEIGPDEARRLVPILSPAAVKRAFYEAGAMDIDVDALHQGFLRGLKARGGAVVTGAELLEAADESGAWTLRTAQGTFGVRVLVNAAGAWGDDVAGRAGVRAIGLSPKRRTAVVIDGETGCARWPMVCSVAEDIYFKPDAGRLLLSPVDETPSPPCDAQPDAIDIATAIDRFGRMTGRTVPRIVAKWAGLRSFVADRAPVAGVAVDHPRFFWLAGQGGYGIKTAPALGRLLAAIVRGESMPADLADQGVERAALQASRLA